ncbi:MAG: hypothetical protein ACKOX6_12075 [Bdellovibrio sp.]
MTKQKSEVIANTSMSFVVHFFKKELIKNPRCGQQTSNKNVGLKFKQSIEYI